MFSLSISLVLVGAFAASAGAAEPKEPSAIYVGLRPTLELSSEEAQQLDKQVRNLALGSKLSLLRETNKVNASLYKQAQEAYKKSSQLQMLNFMLVPRIKAIGPAFMLADEVRDPETKEAGIPMDAGIFPLYEWEKIKSRYPELKALIFKNVNGTGLDLAVVYDEKRLEKKMNVVGNASKLMGELLGGWLGSASEIIGIRRSTGEVVGSGVGQSLGDLAGSASKGREAFIATVFKEFISKHLGPELNRRLAAKEARRKRQAESAADYRPHQAGVRESQTSQTSIHQVK